MAKSKPRRKRIKPDSALAGPTKVLGARLYRDPQPETPGVDPLRLVIEGGTWEQAVRKAMRAGKPSSGSPTVA